MSVKQARPNFYRCAIHPCLYSSWLIWFQFGRQQFNDINAEVESDRHSLIEISARYIPATLINQPELNKVGILYNHAIVHNLQILTYFSWRPNQRNRRTNFIRNPPPRRDKLTPQSNNCRDQCQQREYYCYESLEGGRCIPVLQSQHILYPFIATIRLYRYHRMME